MVRLVFTVVFNIAAFAYLTKQYVARYLYGGSSHRWNEFRIVDQRSPGYIARMSHIPAHAG